jgi:hypothetical protein
MHLGVSISLDHKYNDLHTINSNGSNHTATYCTISILLLDWCLHSEQNGLLNIWNFFIAAGAAMFVNKVGRRRLFIISTIGNTFLSYPYMLPVFTIFLGMLFFWTLQTLCFALVAQDGRKNAGPAFIAFICASYFSFVYQTLVLFFLLIFILASSPILRLL